MVLPVISTDVELLRLLSDLLLPDGYEVVPCATIEAATALPRPFSGAGMVIDGPASTGALNLVARLRNEGSLGPGAPVIFVHDVADDWAEIAAIGARLVTRPAGLLGLTDQLRRAIPSTTAMCTTRTTLPPTVRFGDTMANARCLARWWCTRATGLLRVERSPGGLLSRGGTVGPAGMAAVRLALIGNPVSLDRCEVDEPGDHAALAGALWQAAQTAVLGESVLSLVPSPNGLTQSALGLPLGADTRRCLGRLGDADVQRLAGRERVAVAHVGQDLAAMRWLGLISLRDPRACPVEVEVDAPSLSGPKVALAAPSRPRQAAALVLDRLVQDGISAISRADWARADQLLTRASGRAPSNAIVAAHLGWARYHNPELGSERRSAQGTAYVELALELDPACALAWRYCGEMAAARGDSAEAARCFSAALRLIC